LVMTNRLAGSGSSYLKRASGEPVDWYPWGDEAFERSKKEDRPVLLSIGAVWCHWCHVMAHESWNDPETAKMVNDNFVAIKVDRDERPDLDKAYQEAVSMLTGRGGWPLTVFLTPDKEPFYGGTYFPATSRYGMPSVKDILEAVKKAYKNDRNDLQRTADEIRRLSDHDVSGKGALSSDMPDSAVSRMSKNFDGINGGFGTAPKFPHAEALLFLLQAKEGSHNEDAWNMARSSLMHMAAGGFYDQVGGGFHRYSTDSLWIAPHFEKMLNDNALLLKAYLEAYRLSGDLYFRQVAEEAIGFVFRRMARYEGFVSSIDADLDGEEGAYYTWTEAEIRQALGDRADAFVKAYNVSPDGNFEVRGKNVLYIPRETDKSAFAAEKQILLAARHKRELPFIDTAIHTSWTALMATSLVTAYNVLGDTGCLEFARKTMDFIMSSIYDGDTLFRTYTDKPSVDGFLDDYSCAIEALLELYKAAQEPNYLEFALKLSRGCEEKFYDAEHEGYFYVQKKDRTPMTGDRPAADSTTPGPNPQMALNLLKLYHYTGDEQYHQRAKQVLESFVVPALVYPIGHATFFRAVDYYLNEPLQAVIEADRPEALELARLINGRVDKCIVLLDTGEGRRLPVFEGKSRPKGKPTVFFCKQGTCSMPHIGEEKIKEYLSRQ